MKMGNNHGKTQPPFVKGDLKKNKFTFVKYYKKSPFFYP